MVWHRKQKFCLILLANYSRHIVKKISVALDIDQGMNVQSTRNSVLHLLQSEMKAELSKLMDEVCPENEIVRIDRLELNLGTLRVENFRSVLANQLYEGLYKAIVKAQNEAAKENAGQQAIGSKSNQIQKTKGAQSVNTQTINAFLFMLENGFLPWWSSLDSGVQWHAFFKEEVFNTETSEVAKKRPVYRELVKQTLIERKKARKRFVARFDLDTLAQVIESWFETESKVFKQIQVWVRQLVKLMNWPLSLAQEKRMVLAFLDAMAESRAKIAALSVDLPTINWEWLAGNKEVELAKKLVDLKNDPIRLEKLKKTEKNTEKWLESLSNLFPNQEKTKKQTPLKRKQIQPEKEESRANTKIVDTISTDFAGIVILWPMLSTLFLNRELTVKGEFKSMEAQMKALQLLNFLAVGHEEMEEFQMPLNKLLCGIELDEVPEFTESLSKDDKEELENLLQHVIQNWSAVKSTSPKGLRTSFIARKGELTELDSVWQLKVEESGVDILLSKLPWGYHNIKLPWMSKLIQVEW